MQCFGLKQLVTLIFLRLWVQRVPSGFFQYRLKISDQCPQSTPCLNQQDFGCIAVYAKPLPANLPPIPSTSLRVAEWCVTLVAQGIWKSSKYLCILVLKEKFYQRLQSMHCAACKGPCPTIPLNSKAPATVLKMFKDASGQFKSLTRTLSWQESQKQSIKEHQEMEVKRLEEKAKQQQDELDELEQHLEEKRVQVKSLENVEVQLKSQLSSLASMKFERDGKCPKPKVEVPSCHLQSTPVHKSLGKGSSHGQGPLSSAFYKGMATFGPSTNKSKNDSITSFGGSARCFLDPFFFICSTNLFRNNSHARHFPPANSSWTLICLY